ncbi:hypothetical protein JCM16303_004347 [Sporobolomyces ruberrimus]
MTDGIKLATSDDPPVILSVSRSALISHSRVFADMFAIGHSSKDDEEPISVSATEKELKVFVSIMEGEAEKTENALDAFSEEQWENLAALGDKYDCFSVRKVIESKVWQISAEGGSAAFAFNLAVLTDNTKLAKHAAKRAVLIGDLHG